MTHWQSYHTLPIGTLRCIIFITCDANANSLVLERVLFCASCRAAKATIASTLGTIQGEFEWIRCTVSERFQHIKQGECLHRRLTPSYTWKCGCTDLQQTSVIRHLFRQPTVTHQDQHGSASPFAQTRFRDPRIRTAKVLTAEVLSHCLGPRRWLQICDILRVCPSQLSWRLGRSTNVKDCHCQSLVTYRAKPPFHSVLAVQVHSPAPSDPASSWLSLHFAECAKFGLMLAYTLHTAYT